MRTADVAVPAAVRFMSPTLHLTVSYGRSESRKVTVMCVTCWL